MTQFNFTTNIEKRMPDTGKVFCIDRMTSDYAQAHPLDVDGFIESVYQEFVGTEFEESRETLHNIWTAVLSVTNPRGDASLYPNENGRKRAAAMKVWHKAGDYWRRGFRLGDTLPDMVPMTKITRLDDGGWIALFPKDICLLSTTATTPEASVSGSSTTSAASASGSSTAPATSASGSSTTPAASASGSSAPVTESARNQPEPRQLDLFAFESHRRPVQVRRQHSQAATAAVPSASAVGDNRPWLTIAGYLAAASVALLVIWQTGLLIPLGLIGLATSGFLK